MGFRVFAAVAAVSVVVLVGCTPTPVPPSVEVVVPPSVTEASIAAPSSTPSPSIDPTEAAITQTILGYYKGKDYLRQNPEVKEMYHVAKWTTGEQLTASVKSVMRLRELGYVITGSTIIRDVRVGTPRSVDGVSTSVTTYCEDLTKVGLRKNGAPVDPADPTSQTTATLRLVEGRWLVETLRNVPVKPC